MNMRQSIFIDLLFNLISQGFTAMGLSVAIEILKLQLLSGACRDYQTGAEKPELLMCEDNNVEVTNINRFTFDSLPAVEEAGGHQDLDLLHHIRLHHH